MLLGLFVKMNVFVVSSSVRSIAKRSACSPSLIVLGYWGSLTKIQLVMNQ